MSVAILRFAVGLEIAVLIQKLACLLVKRAMLKNSCCNLRSVPFRTILYDTHTKFPVVCRLCLRQKALAKRRFCAGFRKMHKKATRKASGIFTQLLHLHARLPRAYLPFAAPLSAKTILYDHCWMNKLGPGRTEPADRISPDD